MTKNSFELKCHVHLKLKIRKNRVLTLIHQQFCINKELKVKIYCYVPFYTKYFLEVVDYTPKTLYTNKVLRDRRDVQTTIIAFNI